MAQRVMSSTSLKYRPLLQAADFVDGGFLRGDFQDAPLRIGDELDEFAFFIGDWGVAREMAGDELPVGIDVVT